MPLTREEAVELLARLRNAALEAERDFLDLAVCDKYYQLEQEIVTALCVDPNAALLEALQAVEWVNIDLIPRAYSMAPSCPWCKGLYPNHAPDCARLAALARAEPTDAACANAPQAG